jgi:isopentenyldiphosphate isomerase
MDEAERLRKLAQVKWRQRKLDRTPKDSKDFDWIEWYDLAEEIADLESESPAMKDLHERLIKRRREKRESDGDL